METHHALEVLALARHLEHDRAAEAVADGGDVLAVHGRVLLEHVLRGVEALLGERQVLAHLAGELAGLVRVMRLMAVAVHVQRQRRVAERGEHARAFARVFVVSPPLVHHQHTGALALLRVVIGQVTFEHGIAGLVLDFLALHGGLRAVATNASAMINIQRFMTASLL